MGREATWVRRAGPVAAVLLGLGALLLGLAAYLGESFVGEEQVDCGVSAIDLANRTKEAVGTPAFRRACRDAAHEDVGFGYAVGATGAFLVLRGLAARRIRRRRAGALSSMTEQRRWSTPTRSRDNVPLAAVAVALTAPAALAVVPHAPVLRGIGACLAAIAAVGLFDAVVRWPRVHTDWQGLVIRRRWRRTVRWTWRQVVGVGAGSAEGVVLVSSPEGWSAEVDDHGDEFRGLRGRLRLLVALARDQSVLVTAIAATGPSRAVRPDAEAIAAAIATEVARNGGRPAAELLAPDPEQDLIDDGPARGPVLEVLQTLAIVAFAVAVVWVLSVT